MAIDAAGNVSAASATLTLTIDTTAPAMPTLVGPGTAPVAEARPTLRGTAEPGSVVELRRGDTALARVTAGADGRFELRPDEPLPDGAAEVHAVAIDAAGNVSAASDSLALTIDTTAPASPTLVGPGAAPVAEARPALRGGAEPGSVVELRRGDTALARVTAGADGRFELRPDLAHS